jgi:D-aminopeptidase
VTSWVQVMPPEYGSGPSSTAEYERARARLTREVNAAVEGALAAGADEVIVNEAHNGMRNLVPGAEEALRRAAHARPWRLPEDCRVELDFDHQARAQACLFVPGVERAGERTVAYVAADALAFSGTFRALMKASAVTFSP